MAGDQRLHGYDGDTGAVIYAGGGANELMAGTQSYSTTGIVARGRIYVAGDNKVYAFTLPGGAPTPTPTPTATPTPTPNPNSHPYRHLYSHTCSNGHGDNYTDRNSLGDANGHPRLLYTPPPPR